MKILNKIILFVLVLLAVFSGVSKIMLMPQEVQFFAKYGFNNIILIAFGIIQVIGGLLLLLPKTRIMGAVIIIVAFLISALVLFLSGNLAMVLVTLIFVCLADIVIREKSSAKNT